MSDVLAVAIVLMIKIDKDGRGRCDTLCTAAIYMKDDNIATG